MIINNKEEKDERAKENKMGNQPVVPLLMSMALPPMISMFMQYTYNFVVRKIRMVQITLLRTV